MSKLLLIALVQIIEAQNKTLQLILDDQGLGDEYDLDDIDFEALRQQLSGITALPDTLG
ncbi:hypothetical protein [Microcoleus sp. CAWBG640]|uniref:hypothetical protein n=1 Tax=Microcoleus sp. CAWBG640 TaxID=2841653 RepID=UPI00312BB1A5